ncbi:MAG: histidine triad nucleotide-binding protein [Deltaproteobacteria bacterium]|nr:histidine triad nucleotide-binding protein [Deltaproteobacteria bacterium]
MESECIFCQIARGEQSADIVYRDEQLVAFKDIKPHAPVHILLVPRKHIRSINNLEEEDRMLVAELLFRARQLAGEAGIQESGYRLVFNVERGGGQFVFHLHLHLMGGW